jgi:serine/threonine protein kinase
MLPSSSCYIILTVWMYYRRAFRDELDVLQLIRHPNVVQFLGAVTQSNPMMIVMEFMRKVCFKGNMLFRICIIV